VHLVGFITNICTMHGHLKVKFVFCSLYLIFVYLYLIFSEIQISETHY